MMAVISTIGNIVDDVRHARNKAKSRHREHQNTPRRDGVKLTCQKWREQQDQVFEPLVGAEEGDERLHSLSASIFLANLPAAFL
jgi:hypothetical protein